MSDSAGADARTRPLLPLAGVAPPERRDAAHNREVLLDAAAALVAERGTDCVTMAAVAVRAGVGKGTLFRRFGSREGLMAAVLDHTERAWQSAVISGPPPLGPGAAPGERLHAFGRSRLETTLGHASLIRAAGDHAGRAAAAHSFSALHVRHLLAELGVAGDLPLLAVALLAPLGLPTLHQQVLVDGVPAERVLAAWTDLADRVVSGGRGVAGGR